MTKRALLVGIDAYDHLGELSACANDVEALTPFLRKNDDGSENFVVTPLTSKTARVDRSCLMRHARELFQSDADVVLLYYAGHGASRPGDVVLCTQEGDEHDGGISFSSVLGLIGQSRASEIIVILDCCFSGGAGGHPAVGGDLSYLRQGVAILTASRSNEVAMEEPAIGQGSFSYRLCGALDGGAADVLGNVSVISAYSYLREYFEAGGQIPTFKCNVSNLHRLRRCRSPVSIEDLRRLVRHFGPEPSFELPLDPSYEPTEPPPHPENEATFAVLQRLRAAKLVEPVGTEHMYYAATESRSCRLTPLGRHYRHLAERGLL